MGLAILPHLSEILTRRKEICNIYDTLLEGCVTRPKEQKGLEYNYAYYPVVFRTEKEMMAAFRGLNAEYIYPRRYFYPSLNRLPYLKTTQSCPISEDISRRVACLPLYTALKNENVEQISDIIKKSVKNTVYQVA